MRVDEKKMKKNTNVLSVCLYVRFCIVERKNGDIGEARKWKRNVKHGNILFKTGFILSEKYYCVVFTIAFLKSNKLEFKTSEALEAV